MKVILEVTARKHKIDLLAKSSRLSKKHYFIASVIPWN